MLIDWLIDWMIDWLTVDWLIDWNLVVLVKKKVQRWSNKKPTASRLAQKLPLIFFIHGSFSLRGPRCLCIFFFYCFHLACPPHTNATTHPPPACLLQQSLSCDKDGKCLWISSCHVSRSAALIFWNWSPSNCQRQTATVGRGGSGGGEAGVPRAFFSPS